MNMIHPDPVPSANALAKSMIDAVTGHQPSPLDREHHQKDKPNPTRKMAGKMPNLVGHEADESDRSNDVR
jgi:hypothetical protein